MNDSLDYLRSLDRSPQTSATRASLAAVTPSNRYYTDPITGGQVQGNAAPVGGNLITANSSSGGSSSGGSSGGGMSGGMSGGNVALPSISLGDANAAADPWSKYRAGAGDQLAAATAKGDPSDLYRDKLAEMSTGKFSTNDPSYAFRFQQGQQASERSLASRGLLNSGNAALELQQYGQQAASQEYSAQFDRMLQGLSGVSSQYDTQMNRLMEMAGVGNDPTAGGKLQVAGMAVQADIMKGNQSYDLGLRNVGVAQQANQTQASSNMMSLLSKWL